ncbi:MAG: pentapeptide repeat-containing protein [Saprospiraceae bacterium]|nr:pentapeptide repeat-containing protein [Saprospiraceae bacterium]MBK8669353.1 pentapeptide repeat-containing protein [Saprospiraceae bacterium]
MSLPYIKDHTFHQADCLNKPLEKAEYEYCQFLNIDMGSADLSGFSFTDCTFVGCNLSMSRISKTSFKSIKWKGCKIMGLKWDECNPFLFSVSFEDCMLDLSIFYGVRLKKTSFVRSSLKETDFSEADLEHAVFEDCDLAGAVFDGSNLSQCDFSTARQYIIDPEQNYIKNAIFSWPGVSGLLVKYGIRLVD